MAEAYEREHDARAWLAWHIEYLHRTKRLPKLETMMSKARKKRPRQTWQEQMAIMGQWANIMNKVEEQKQRMGITDGR